jgi:hypothetical protein
MLQELYSETGAAAQAIVEEVAPAVNETTKEEIAGAAVDRAEAIADHIADTVKLEQSEHAAIVEACAQVIYAETLAELADNAKITALESLFTEEYVQDFYSELEAEQEQYAESNYKPSLKDRLKAGYGSAKGFAKANAAEIGAGAAIGGVAGAGGGLILARRKAAAAGLQPGTPQYKRFIAKYMAGGAAAGIATGGAVGAGYGAYKNRAVVGKGKSWRYRNFESDTIKGARETLKRSRDAQSKK